MQIDRIKQVDQIILASGESLTRVEVLRAFLLLAGAEASFPLLTRQDTHLACLLLLPEVLEQAELDKENED